MAGGHQDHKDKAKKKDAEGLKFPECTVSSVFVDCGLLDRMFPMDPRPTLTAARQQDAGGRGEAGEVFLHTRGSSSLGGMEGV